VLACLITFCCKNKRNSQTEQPVRCRNAVQLSAARGKLCDNSPQAQLGCITNITVPQQWFLHFYVAGSVCNTCLLYCVLTSWPPGDTCSPQRQVCSIMQLVARFLLLRHGDIRETKHSLKPNESRQSALQALCCSKYILSDVWWRRLSS
jgi:hypothetical protein